jgi:hypothetical protein
MDNSGASVCPDFLVWLANGILAFKGEERASVIELHAARGELKSKVELATEMVFFGGLPYRLAYAMGGLSVQFFALGIGRRGECTALTSVLDLSTCAGCSECVRTVVNIARVLLCMQETFPRCLELESYVEMENSCKVWIKGTCARKVASAGPHLMELYD